jgi:hypothetical protein
MLKPNYKDGSIVNLMSSIASACGGKLQYDNLKLLPFQEIKDSKNIVLIVLDGLGYEYLRKTGKNILTENLKGKITSVFPPTTAAGVTTFLTGTAPQQHAMTGWYIFLKEIGVVSAILPYVQRIGGPPISSVGIEMKEFFTEKRFSTRIKTESYHIGPEEIINSDYTRETTGKAKKIGYKDLKRILFAN